MARRYKRDRKGRFATVGESKANERREVKRRLNNSIGSKSKGNRTLRQSLGKRVISKQEKASRGKFLRGRKRQRRG